MMSAADTSAARHMTVINLSWRSCLVVPHRHTHCSQSHPWPRPRNPHRGCMRGFLSLIASPYSTGVMSPSITSRYRVSACSCASLCDVMSLTLCRPHVLTHRHMQCGLSLRLTITLTFTDYYLKYKVIS